jgi:hypothetical protein
MSIKENYLMVKFLNPEPDNPNHGSKWRKIVPDNMMDSYDVVLRSFHSMNPDKIMQESQFNYPKF